MSAHPDEDHLPAQPGMWLYLTFFLAVLALLQLSSLLYSFFRVSTLEPQKPLKLSLPWLGCSSLMM